MGIDNLNDYYDVRLKDYRLGRLLGDQARPVGDNPKVSVYAGNVQRSALSSQVSAFSFQRFHFRFLDIENLAALDALFAEFKFDAVFNLAARAGVRYSLENPHVYLSTNTLGTLNILECMRKHGVKKHVLASTSSLYAGCPMPFTEDQPVNTPLSPYAATKKSAEMLAWTWHKVHGIDSTVLRYFTVYGPAGRPDMAPYRFVHWVATGQPIKLFGDGTASRDFTYVDDIARGTILAVKPLGYEVINIGGGNQPIQINAMIAMIEGFLGKKAKVDYLPVNPVDMTDTSANINKAKILFGWIPNVEMSAGFQRLCQWYLDERHFLEALSI